MSGEIGRIVPITSRFLSSLGCCSIRIHRDPGNLSMDSFAYETRGPLHMAWHTYSKVHSTTVAFLIGWGRLHWHYTSTLGAKLM